MACGASSAEGVVVKRGSGGITGKLEKRSVGSFQAVVRWSLIINEAGQHRLRSLSYAKRIILNIAREWVYDL